MQVWGICLFLVRHTKAYDEKLPSYGVDGIEQQTRSVVASISSMQSLSIGVHIPKSHGELRDLLVLVEVRIAYLN